ncbi:MAG TPA: Crp/Fnr family transcriptional regulator [Usitatibacter sp.]|nr:Crp/Fnr family transcriptional regulator [Usitatibacter sp.]
MSEAVRRNRAAISPREVLAASAFFRVLPASSRDRLAAAMRTTVLSNDEVLLANDSRRRLWLVLSGSLRVVLGAGERATTIGVIGPGGFYNVAALLRRRGPSTEARAVGQTRVAVIEGSVLDRLIDEDAALKEHIGAIVMAKLNAVFILFRDAIDAPLPERIARRLLSMALSAGAIVPDTALRLTQGMLAEMLGASRTRVSEELAHLERAGILRLGYRTIHISEADKLRELAGPDVEAS